MDYSFAESVISLKLLADRLCEGKNKRNGLFLVDFQILFILSKYDQVSPKTLTEDLGIAKSNLAIIAKRMIKDGLIERIRFFQNRKEIYYQITPKGKQVLVEKVAQINAVTPETRKDDINLLNSTINLLKSVK